MADKWSKRGIRIRSEKALSASQLNNTTFRSQRRTQWTLVDTSSLPQVTISSFIFLRRYLQFLRVPRRATHARSSTKSSRRRKYRRTVKRFENCRWTSAGHKKFLLLVTLSRSVLRYRFWTIMVWGVILLNFTHFFLLLKRLWIFRCNRTNR